MSPEKFSRLPLGRLLLLFLLFAAVSPSHAAIKIRRHSETSAQATYWGSAAHDAKPDGDGNGKEERKRQRRQMMQSVAPHKIDVAHRLFNTGIGLTVGGVVLFALGPTLYGALGLAAWLLAIGGGIALFGAGIIVLTVAIVLFARYGKFVDKKRRRARRVEDD